MEVKTYDPKKLVVSFGGIPITGFADGTFIQITTNTEAFTKKIGADGEVGRSRGNDDTSEVTVTLIQTSQSNTYLTGVHTTDKLTNAGALPLMITDLLGKTVFMWDSAWIKKLPDFEAGKEISDRAWVFDTGQPVVAVIGGDY
jgi:hypothetical protein